MNQRQAKVYEAQVRNLREAEAHVAAARDIIPGVSALDDALNVSVTYSHRRVGGGWHYQYHARYEDGRVEEVPPGWCAYFHATRDVQRMRTAILQMEDRLSKNKWIDSEITTVECFYFYALENVELAIAGWGGVFDNMGSMD
jgi:hypothetical protein